MMIPVRPDEHQFPSMSLLPRSCIPWAARKQASDAPAGPAPTIRRSVLMMSESAILARICDAWIKSLNNHAVGFT